MHKLRAACHAFVGLYVDGFRQMTWGRKLWVIVVVKLILIFAVLKLFFFPDFIGTHRGHQSASDFVSSQVLPPHGSSQELPPHGSSQVLPTHQK